MNAFFSNRRDSETKYTEPNTQCLCVVIHSNLDKRSPLLTDILNTDKNKKDLKLIKFQDKGNWMGFRE